MNMRKMFLMCTILLTLAVPVFAQQPQLATPRPSPKATVMQSIGLTDVTINYNRPSVRGRKVWGELVPMGQVWRTGANEATTVQFSDDVTINGQALPKGLYSLHTIPGEKEWTVIFNSVAQQWGSYSYDPAKDVLRVKVTPERSSASHELMTFDFPRVSADEGTMVMRWENVAVPVVIGTNSTQKTLANARAAVAAAKADDWRTPYQAASFAYTNKVALEDAKRWLDQSLKANENAINLYFRARVLAEQGDKAGAIRSAEAALAKTTPEQKTFADEIRRNIDSWKK